ncbi:MAG: phosphoserine phosphatase [Plesiomonas sp.]|uniref:phosphoserine phosphatase n=3 Tax=Plesiomonas sp. TaxID=2486279 RepID=UPI003F2CD4D2
MNLKDNDFTRLPSRLSEWSCLPLLLQGHEAIPLDYTLGEGGWLLYGKNLDKAALVHYQGLLDMPLVVQGAWHVADYQVVQFAGQYSVSAADIADKLGWDTAALSALPSLRSPGLLVMDMDSTAIQIECIDEIATLAGTGPQVAEVTERAMRGELDFAQSLRQRVATLQGADSQILDQVLADLPLMPGLTALVQQLQTCGWQVAIASGGFTYFAEHLQRLLGLCHVEANVLGICDNLLTGDVEGEIVDAERKAVVLRQLADQYQIPLTNTVGIGDGANDLKMLHAAGLGIAFHAKPTVQAQAQVVIRHADLLGVLCILSASIGRSL